MPNLTILIDNREKLPWTFETFKNKLPFNRMVTRSATADYTIEGGSHEIAIERKSLVDILQTMGLAKDTAGNRKRDRFSFELQRMQQVNNSFVIIEAPLSLFLKAAGIKRQIAKILLIRAIIRFKLKFPRTRWIFCANRAEAETAAFVLMWKTAKSLPGSNLGPYRGVDKATTREAVKK